MNGIMSRYILTIFNQFINEGVYIILCFYGIPVPANWNDNIATVSALKHWV